MQTQTIATTIPVTSLMLADRLISLAQDADRAGYARSATSLLGLAYAVFDEEKRPEMRPAKRSGR